MTAYYNEIDPYCVEWLKNLIAQNLIAPGVVDSRPIQDIKPYELSPYTQCHFFAGLGGWSYALRLANWPDHRSVWTGSCPCQPFSQAGARRGFADERHLWPYWQHLINIRRPAVVFGEQVASASQWLGLVRCDLEAMEYAVGCCPVEAASAGADHLRDRFWFVARRGVGLADAQCARLEGQSEQQVRGVFVTESGDSRVANGHTPGRSEQRCGELLDRERPAQRDDLDGCGQNGVAHSDFFFQGDGKLQRGGQFGGTGGDQEARVGSDVGNAHVARSQGRGVHAQRGDERIVGAASVEHAACERRREGRAEHEVRSGRDAAAQSSGSRYEWITGADGKQRRVKPGICLLAHGVSARISKLRAFGNAIYPPAAQAFIEAYLDTLDTPVV